jgi:hypothetical protein
MAATVLSARIVSTLKALRIARPAVAKHLFRAAYSSTGSLALLMALPALLLFLLSLPPQTRLMQSLLLR